MRRYYYWQKDNRVTCCGQDDGARSASGRCFHAHWSMEILNNCLWGRCDERATKTISSLGTMLSLMTFSRLADPFKYAPLTPIYATLDGYYCILNIYYISFEYILQLKIICVNQSSIYLCNDQTCSSRFMTSLLNLLLQWHDLKAGAVLREAKRNDTSSVLETITKQ